MTKPAVRRARPTELQHVATCRMSPFVARRVESRLEDYSEFPGSYDLTEAEGLWMWKLLHDVDVPYCRESARQVTVKLPFYGKEHPAQALLCRVLTYATEDAWAIDREDGFTDRAHDKTVEALRHFEKTGLWDTKATPKRPKAPPLPVDEKAFRAEVNAKAQELMRQQAEYLMANPEVVDLKRTRFLKDWQLKTSWSPGRRYSRGGIHQVGTNWVPWVNLSLSGLSGGRDKKHHFTEYAHIKNRKDIGEMLDVGWEKYLAALIAHELAHAAVDYHGQCVPKHRWPKGMTRAQLHVAHGEFWRSIYRALRNEFVN